MSKPDPPANFDDAPSDETPLVDGGSSVSEAAPPLAPGTPIDTYRIKRFLGRGGLGDVYLAEHTHLQIDRAIKLLKSDVVGRADAVARFRREAQLLAKLQHPNIAAAFDAGEYALPDGSTTMSLYVAMEYVPGADLRAHVKARGPLDPARACEYIRQAALGLQYAHQQAMVHRDIKPSNLMLSEQGQIKILDLGLARFVDNAWETAETVTKSGVIMGTLDDLAPEQARDAVAVDARSDLYSLGCTFYFLLVGEPPFHKFSLPVEKLAAQLDESPPPLLERRPDLPPSVVKVVERLLAKDPEERFGDAGSLIEALDAIGEQPATSRRTGRGGRYVGAVLLGLLVLAALWIWQPWRSGDTAGDNRGGSNFTKAGEGGGPADRRLESLTFYLAPEGPSGPVGVHPAMQEAGQFTYEPTQPLRQTAAFRISGRFAQPTYWYLVWFDSAGAISVEQWSPRLQQDLQYPPDESVFQTINPSDPEGVHLLLLVTSDAEPKQGRSLLQQRLSQRGEPSTPTMPRWASLLGIRGPGKRVVIPQPRRVREAVAHELPPGFQPAFAIFLKTEKD